MSHPIMLRPTLVRWSFTAPISLFNVVIMDFPDAETHEKEWFENGRSGAEVWGEDVERGVEGMQGEVRRVVGWREEGGKA